MLDIQKELAKLKGVIEPDIDISIFPLAPIWYVAIVIIILVIIFFILYRIHRNSTALKRNALSRLLVIEKDLNSPTDNNINIINNISVLLRKTALLKFKEPDMAAITDNKWLEFLDSNLDKKYFQTETGNLLINANYQKELLDNSNLQNLINISRIWIIKNL